MINKHKEIKMTNKTNEKFEEKYKERLEKDINSFKEELTEDVSFQLENYKIRLLNHYKSEEDDKKNEQEWRQTPLYKKIGIIAGESAVITGLIGLGVGLFSLMFYLFNENSSCNQKREQTYEIKKPKKTYGIEVFYDKGKELTAEINSLENKIKYAEPQNSTKYSKQIDSLKEQYSHIKDGIEYIKLNDSEDYNNLINKQNICIF